MRSKGAAASTAACQQLPTGRTVRPDLRPIRMAADGCSRYGHCSRLCERTDLREHFGKHPRTEWQRLDSEIAGPMVG
jgi:hypothetical protein